MLHRPYQRLLHLIHILVRLLDNSQRQVQIVPDEDKLAMMGFSIEDIESALAANNVEPGSMTVRDGYYEYNIKFSTLLRTAEDVKNIYLRKGDRIVQLKDFCKVTIVPVKEKGVSVSNGKRAVHCWPW